MLLNIKIFLKKFFLLVFKSSHFGMQFFLIISIFICFRFLFVSYNAWQYAGSDNLWVGLVANIDEKIEDEFGAFTTRMFRTFSMDTVEKSTFNFTDLLLQFENDKINQCQTDEIKTKLKKLLGEKLKFKPLEEWESRYNYSVDISNKEKWWVVKCYNREQAEEAHNRLQSYRDLKVSFLETPRSVISKNSLWKQIKSYPRMNYIFSMSTLFLLILASIALLIYSLTVVRKVFLFKNRFIYFYWCRRNQWFPTIGSR